MFHAVCQNPHLFTYVIADSSSGTWIDSDFTDGTNSAAFKFRTSAYGEKVVDIVTNNNQCGFTLWGRDDGPIAGKPSARC